MTSNMTGKEFNGTYCC
uniref:Uncharacterized protein n=1 Tax=Anguilla anguilla TaxID=7936 RepID=A0A0E9VJV5_ANGAN